MVSVRLKYRTHFVRFLLTLASIILVILLFIVGAFNLLEHKIYDFKFKLRGPLSGFLAHNGIPKNTESFTDENGNGIWDTGEPFIDTGNEIWDKGEIYDDLNRNGIYDNNEQFLDIGNGRWDKGMDVVIVDLDDEAWRLIPDAWPYPRGTLWSKVIYNLTDAGAKTIVFDIEFDKPDHSSQHIIKSFGDEEIPRSFEHGDNLFLKAIQYAQTNGTDIVFGAKRVKEPTRLPPEYIMYPVEKIMESKPEIGMVGEFKASEDAVTREYIIYSTVNNEDAKVYLSIGLKAVKEYLDIPDSCVTVPDLENEKITYGPLTIKTHGQFATFMINYYGPTSIASPFGSSYKTFDRYPLSNVLDDTEYQLEEDDTDWMSIFIDPSNPLYHIPDFGGLENSPFNGKIVVIGLSTEVIHDVKATPYFSYLGYESLMPGVEIHANAIQQILDNNYISVPTHSLSYSNEGRFSQISTIILFSLITFLVLTFLNTTVSSIVVGIEIVVWFLYSVGAFVQDSLWFFKLIAFKILPESWIEVLLSSLTYNVPEMGKSVMLPVVFPIISIFTTYVVNLSYSLISSQKDRKFLKGTFETYISPELIEQMYEDKREPKLGGDEGMRTAFFSDIQSFSTFSELLNPTELVELLNEFFTPMTNLLLKHKGTLDKYEGDSIVAFFGAPIPMNDHAKQAIDTAIEMQEKLNYLRTVWTTKSEKWPELVSQMRMRIGINSGNIVTGNMGSAVRMNYTMMGDVVNTASRIEMAAKYYGVYIHCSENSLKMA